MTPEQLAVKRVVGLGLGFQARPGVLVDFHGVASLTGSTYDAIRSRHYRGHLLRPAGRIGGVWVWWADEVQRWDRAGRPHREAWR